MRPHHILAGLTSLWSTRGSTDTVDTHHDAAPVPVGCCDGPEISHLRPRQDFDAKAAAEAAIDAMNTKFYSSSPAIWSPSEPWWLSGFALTAVIDYMRKTKSTTYVGQVKNIIQAQRAQWNGDFRAESTDDTGWWALAMVRMYDLTGDSTYLNISIKDEAYMYQYWTSSPCGGGMFVDIKAKTYKNAIANGLYIKLATSLHNRIASDTKYLSRAETAWSWFQASGMINSDRLINDGLASDSKGACFNNKLPVWTYNQGVILGALAELYHATKNTTHLTTARTLADAALSPASKLTLTVTSNNNTKKILTESSCTPDELNGCNVDQQVFKGPFALNLAELAAVLSEAKQDSTSINTYRDFLRQNAQSAHDHARSTGSGEVKDLYDVAWAGPFRNSTLAKQAGALGLLVAVV